MVFEHTHRHKVQTAYSGEFLQLTLLGGALPAGTGYVLTNALHYLEAETDRLMRLKFGVRDALSAAGVADFEVHVAACQFQDVNSPPWLFEVVARRCIRAGLADPTVTYSEAAPIPRPKNKPPKPPGAFSHHPERARATLLAGIGASGIDLGLATWLQKWRGDVTVAGYRSAGSEHIVDVEGSGAAMRELPDHMRMHSSWTSKEGDRWAQPVSSTAHLVTEWTLNMVYENGLNAT